MEISSRISCCKAKSSDHSDQHGAALIRGSNRSSVHRIRGEQFYATIHVNITQDDGYLFVANERGGTITVVNLKQARASGFGASGIAGNIPAAEAPIAVTLSPDEKFFTQPANWRQATDSQ